MAGAGVDDLPYGVEDETPVIVSRRWVLKLGVVEVVVCGCIEEWGVHGMEPFTFGAEVEHGGGACHVGAEGGVLRGEIVVVWGRKH